MDAGIDGSRVYVRGYGEAFPVASNDTREGRQRNRRVEVVISDERGAIGPRVATYVPR
jgi:outer membrane protein OmpA-like peptidoglycan-associated protein